MLTVKEDGRRVTVANPYYKIMFWAEGPYSFVEFVKTSKKVKFYWVNSMLHDTKRLEFPDAKPRRAIEKSPDGKTICLSFSGNCKSESYNVDYQIRFTFFNDKPVIGFEGEISQDPIIYWQAGSFNFWGFGNYDVAKLMPGYCTGPSPREEGILSDKTGGTIEAKNWRKKYKYFAICDDISAFGMITPSQEDASIHIDKKLGGYITGSRIRTDGRVLRTKHYIYAGPKDGLAGWAEKVYSGK